MSKIISTNPIVGTESPMSQANRSYNYAQALNGGLDFGPSTETDLTQKSGNMKGIWANVTAPAVADTEFSVPHKLGYVPSWYMFNSDRACTLYQLPTTGTAWDAVNIFVKCNVGSAVLRIYIQ